MVEMLLLKNITFPTDAKLYRIIIAKVLKMARKKVSIRPSTSPEREMLTGISLMPVVFFLCQLDVGGSWFV